MSESLARFRKLMNALNDVGIAESHRMNQGLVDLAGVVNGKLIKAQLVVPTTEAGPAPDTTAPSDLKKQQQAHLIEQLRSAGLEDQSVTAALEAWANASD